jgi:hypothetical protein
MYPGSWGYLLWPIIHLWAKNYPISGTKTKLAIEEIYKNHLPFLLLCMGCTFHCDEYIAEHPITFQGDAGEYGPLFKWSVDFHNAVNARTGKRQFTEKEAMQHLHQQCSEPHAQLDILWANELRRVWKERIEWVQKLCRDHNIDESVPPLPEGVGNDSNITRANRIILEDTYAMNSLRQRLMESGIDLQQLESQRNEKMRQAEGYLNDENKEIERLKKQRQSLQEEIRNLSHQKNNTIKSQSDDNTWLWILGSGFILLLALGLLIAYALS